MAIEHPLDFEKPLVEAEMELQIIRDQVASGDLTKQEDFKKAEAKVAKLRSEIYGKLTPFQRVQLSRHFDRPFSLDYINHIFTDFTELHGDRLFRDDPAIVGGTARLGELPVMVVGHQRGKELKERLKRNFGMPNPEGYRKALRLFQMANKFKMPLITLIDTQGAYPGLEAEERGQAEAIATNLEEMAALEVPVLTVVIGEGGSGGALALGVGDKLLMMENACYSVITPEGCASILYGAAGETQTAQAAEVLQLTAHDLHKLKVCDQIVPEPLGGAHHNHKDAAENLKVALIQNLEELGKLTVGELLDGRYKKLRGLGPFEVVER